MSNANNTRTVIADICLYGNHNTGAGWLASPTNDVKPAAGTRRPMLGNGEPVRGRSCTEAVWLAADAIRNFRLGYGLKNKGTLAIFAPGGELVAYVELNGRVPAFGDLRWERAPVYEVSAETILAAGAAQ